MTPEPPSLPLLAEGIIKLADILEKSRINYGLMGGIAIALHGVPRATGDADVLLSVEKIRLAALLDIVEKAGFSFHKSDVLKELNQDGLSHIGYQRRRIDLMMPILPLFSKCLKRTVTVSFFGTPIKIVSPEDLILFKLLAFRPQDQEDIQAIVAIKGKDQLQLDYLHEWMPQLIPPNDERLHKVEEWIKNLA